MSKRLFDESDFEGRFKKRQRYDVPEESIENKLDELIVRIGEKSQTSLDTNIEDLAMLFNFESDSLPSNNRVVAVFCECVAEFPQKICIYSTLVGLLNARNYSFGGEVIEQLLKDFKKLLNAGDYERARILVRFMADLVNTRVVSSSSLVALFESLVDVTMEDNIPQVRSDYFVYTVLSALPFVGKELYEKKETELDQILNTIDNYITKRTKSVHWDALRVWHSSEPLAQEEYLDCLWKQITKLSAEKWVDYHIYRPYLNFDSQLCEALQHNLPPLKPPQHEPENVYPIPQVIFRLFDYTDCPDNTALPGAHAIERFLIEDNLRCILNQNCFDRKDCANALLTYSNLSIAKKVPLDHIIIEVMLGELFRLPKSYQPEVCYGSILLDLCKLNPSTFPLALAQAVELVFDRLDTMNGSCINRFASWFAYHLSNFQFRWNWDDWSVVLKQEPLHPKPKFIAEAMLYMRRLSYHQQILDVVPQTFHRLAPVSWSPKNKYVMRKPMVSESGGTEQQDGGDVQMAEVPLDEEQVPGAEVAAKIVTALKERASADTVIDLLADIGGMAARVEVFVTCLLNCASNSMTHTFAAVARYQNVLQTLNEGDEGQLAILNTIVEVWSTHQQLVVVLIDKLIKAGVLHLSSVATWIFSKSNTDEFMKFYMWEILHTVIKRSLRSVATATKEVAEARDKLNKQEESMNETPSVPDDENLGVNMTDDEKSEQPMTAEQLEKLVEKLEAVQTDQKNLLLITFQRFIMILTEHMQTSERLRKTFKNYWFFWTITRMQEVFFEYHETIFKYVKTFEDYLFTSNVDANIVAIFRQFRSLRA